MPDPLAWLDDHRDAQLETLFELLRIPSVANVRAEPHPCRTAAEWLAAHCGSLGLDARILETAGQPVVFAEGGPDDAPTLLIYGHYDVQPAAPLDPWQTDPFEPVVRDGAIVARGANDDKGQLFTHLMALEACAAAGGLPVRVKLLLEGEEEVGSPTLEPFVAEHAELLAADAAVISDSEFWSRAHPSLTYALRGLAYFELRLRALRADVHSGVNGGAAPNPIHALAGMIAAMHDADGRITLEGFYDDVRPLAEAERQAWASLNFDADAYARDLGAGALNAGERGYSVLERRWARPTLDCNGIVGGYTEPGSKTIIPAEASAKVSMRLVSDQDPDRVAESFRRFVEQHTPEGMVAAVDTHATARPVMLPTDSPAMRAGRRAVADAFDAEPVLIRCGASVPVTELFQRLLDIDAVLMGFGLPDDNIHSPNERFELNQLFRGARACAAFYRALPAGG